MSRPRETTQKRNWSPAKKIIAGDQLPNGSAQRPAGIGHTLPAPSKDSGPTSAFALSGTTIFQLATKKVTSPDALRERLKWVWVKPTKTRTIFF